MKKKTPLTLGTLRRIIKEEIARELSYRPSFESEDDFEFTSNNWSGGFYGQANRESGIVSTGYGIASAGDGSYDVEVVTSDEYGDETFDDYSISAADMAAIVDGDRRPSGELEVQRFTKDGAPWVSIEHDAVIPVPVSALQRLLKIR